MEKIQTTLEFLPEFPIAIIFDQSCELLARTGIRIEDSTTRKLLLNAGARKLPGEANRIALERQLVESCLRMVPPQVTLYNRDESKSLEIGGKNLAFVPGSAALNFFDWQTQQHRPAVTGDLVQHNLLVQQLPNFPAQATAIVSSDVPQGIADSYRLYLALGLNSKPIVTGLFQISSFPTVLEMLLTVRGDEQRLREKPLAIFDCCPMSPLKWDTLSCQTILACARSGIPVQLVPMPLPGATAPISLYQTLVQYLAEILSGLVIGQLAGPGAPMIAGSAPAIFDLRTANPAIGAAESLLLAAGFTRIARTLNLPTHAYLGLTDAHFADVQAGFESGFGLLLSALSGVNLVTGSGLLSCINAYSPEKLVIDHDFCGQILRFRQGIAVRTDRLQTQFVNEIQAGNYFLTAPETLELFREEQALDYRVIERSAFGTKSIGDRANHWLKENNFEGNPILPNTRQALTQMMEHAAKATGMNRLPYRL